jgi:hypothetical protein
MGRLESEEYCLLIKSKLESEHRASALTNLRSKRMSEAQSAHHGRNTAERAAVDAHQNMVANEQRAQDCRRHHDISGELEALGVANKFPVLECAALLEASTFAEQETAAFASARSVAGHETAALSSALTLAQQAAQMLYGLRSAPDPCVTGLGGLLFSNAVDMSCAEIERVSPSSFVNTKYIVRQPISHSRHIRSLPIAFGDRGAMGGTGRYLSVDSFKVDSLPTRDSLQVLSVFELKAPPVERPPHGCLVDIRCPLCTCPVCFHTRPIYMPYRGDAMRHLATEVQRLSARHVEICEEWSHSTSAVDVSHRQEGYNADVLCDEWDDLRIKSEQVVRTVNEMELFISQFGEAEGRPVRVGTEEQQAESRHTATSSFSSPSHFQEGHVQRESTIERSVSSGRSFKVRRDVGLRIDTTRSSDAT